MARIDKDYDFTHAADSKIKQRWYWLGIVADYKPVMEEAHKFVSTQGKTENLQFIYQALVDFHDVDTAKKWLAENKAFYHPAAYNKIESLIQKAVDMVKDV